MLYLGSKTYARISDFISSIIQEYQLEGKVQHIVTDNGLNFVKAIKDYFQKKDLEASVVVTESIKDFNELLADTDEFLDGFVELELDSQDSLYEILKNRLLDCAQA